MDRSTVPARHRRLKRNFWEKLEGHFGFGPSATASAEATKGTGVVDKGKAQSDDGRHYWYVEDSDDQKHWREKDEKKDEKDDEDDKKKAKRDVGDFFENIASEVHADGATSDIGASLSPSLWAPSEFQPDASHPLARSLCHLVDRVQGLVGRRGRFERRLVDLVRRRRRLVGGRRCRFGHGEQHGRRVVQPDDVGRRHLGRVPRDEAQDQRAVGPLGAFSSLSLASPPSLAHLADTLAPLPPSRRSASPSSSSSPRSSSSPSSTARASSTRAAAAATPQSALSSTSPLRRRRVRVARGARGARLGAGAGRGASRWGVTPVRLSLSLSLFLLARAAREAD